MFKVMHKFLAVVLMLSLVFSNVSVAFAEDIGGATASAGILMDEGVSEPEIPATPGELEPELPATPGVTEPEPPDNTDSTEYIDEAPVTEGENIPTLEEWKSRTFSSPAPITQSGDFIAPIDGTVGVSVDLTPQYGSNSKFIAPIDSPAAGSIALSNRADLEKIGNNPDYPLDGKYHLTGNINLDDAEWVPIGNDEYDEESKTYPNVFTGTFDGQGYVISSMTITADISCAGLFGFITGATIKNVGLESTYINITRISDNIAAGGICGRAASSNISNCYNAGDVTVAVTNSGFSSASAGGICGEASSVAISICYNIGDVTATGTGYGVYAGGICGVLGDIAYLASISNCYNAGDVFASITVDSYDEDVDSSIVYAKAGGICGKSVASTDGAFPELPLDYTGQIISNCYNTGNVSATAPSSVVEVDIDAGGICGNFGVGNFYFINTTGSGPSVVNCYNAGNVTVSSSTLIGTSAAAGGGICGSLYYAAISNCYNTGNVTANSSSFSSPIDTTDYSNAYAGGICGNDNARSYSYASSITNCYNTGNVDASAVTSFVDGYSAAYAGGICGNNSDSLVDNCYNTGNVSAVADAPVPESEDNTSNAYAYAGGICGRSYECPINDSYNMGTVSATATNTATDGRANAGGISGDGQRSVFGNCYNTGDVTATSPYSNVGGICGSGSEVYNCYNAGDIFATPSVSTSSVSFAGGIGPASYIENCYNIGNVSGVVAGGISSNAYYISNCYNTGDVAGTSSDGFAGGICGINNGEIYDCYNTGNVSITSISDSFAGGICGWNRNDEGIFENCYWNSDSDQMANNNPQNPKKGIGRGEDITTPLTTAQMKNATNLIGFDFTDVWDLSPTVNNGYPFIRGMTVVDGGDDGDGTIPVTGVTLNKTSSTLTAGETEQLTATVNPANASNKAITWTSGNAGVATVSDGLVTAVEPGTATITVATVDGNFTATCQVTVFAPASTPEITTQPTNQTSYTGETAIFRIKAVLPAPDKSVKNGTLIYQWQKLNGSAWEDIPQAVSAQYETPILTMSDNGSKYRCVVTHANPLSGFTPTTIESNAATLTVGVAVSEITITQTLSMILNETQTLDTVIEPNDATNKSLIWSSNNARVATVDENGEVTALSTGMAVITVKSATHPAVYAICIVTVLPADVTYDFAITVDGGDEDFAGKTIKGKVKDSIELTADLAKVTWKSAETKVATVTSGGLVKFVGTGTAKITATGTGADTSKSAFVYVSVSDTKPRLSVNTITVNKYTYGTEFQVFPPDDDFIFDNIEIVDAPEGLSIVNQGIDSDGCYTVKLEAAEDDFEEYEDRNGNLKVREVPVIKNGTYKITMITDAPESDAFELTVKVTKETPNFTVKMPTLNAFYSGASGQISITGKNLPAITGYDLYDIDEYARVKIDGEYQEYPKYGNITENFYVGIDEDGACIITATEEMSGYVDSYKENPTQLAVTGVLIMSFENYKCDFGKHVTVPVKFTAPKLTLKPATQTINTKDGAERKATFQVIGGQLGENSYISMPYTLKFQEEDENGRLKWYTVHEWIGIDDINPDHNTFTLDLDYLASGADIPETPVLYAPGKAMKLDIQMEGTTRAVRVTATVKESKAATTYKLSATTVTLNNTLAEQSQLVEIIPNHSGILIESLDINEDNKNRESGIEVDWVDDPDMYNGNKILKVSMVSEDTKPGTYKFNITPNNIARPLVLTVKVDGKVLIATLKAEKGNIDLLNRADTKLTYVPTIKGTTSAIKNVTLSKDSKDTKDVAGISDYTKFDAVLVDGKVVITARMDEPYQKGKAYKMQLAFTLDGENVVYSKGITVKPAQSKVVHAVPKDLSMFQNSTGMANAQIVSLTPVSPVGSKISDVAMKAGGNPKHAFWYYFEPASQQLYVWIVDSGAVKPGKNTLVFSVTYVGQGVENVGTKANPNYQPKPIDLKIPIVVVR